MKLKFFLILLEALSKVALEICRDYENSSVVDPDGVPFSKDYEVFSYAHSVLVDLENEIKKGNYEE